MEKKFLSPNHFDYYNNPNVLQTGRSQLYNIYPRLNW